MYVAGARFALRLVNRAEDLGENVDRNIDSVSYENKWPLVYYVINSSQNISLPAFGHSHLASSSHSNLALLSSSND